MLSLFEPQDPKAAERAALEAELAALLELEEQDKRAQSWASGNLRAKLHPGQVEIWDKLEREVPDEVLLLISRQWGKSWLTCCLALRDCIRNPGKVVRIAAPTLKQARDIVADNLDIIIQDAPEGLIKRQKTDYRWQVGSSSLRLGVLERAHVDTLRGGNAISIYLEEAGFVSSDDLRYALDSVIGPQLLHSRGRIMHVSTPSEDPQHYLHTEILPRCEARGLAFRYTIYDNPRLDESQIDKAARLCGGTHTASWRREYLAEVVRDTALLCVPEFNQDSVVDVLSKPSHSSKIVSVDWGGVRDKTVGLAGYWDFMGSQLVIEREVVYPPNSPTDDIVAGLKQITHEDALKIADAPGQVLVDLASKHKWQAVMPLKDDWQAGLAQVRVAFGQGRILIKPECPFLIATLNGAQFNKQRTDYLRTEFLGHNDALAALIYAWRMIDKETNPFPLPTYDGRITAFKPRSSGLGRVADRLVRR